MECARLHPEILARDAGLLAASDRSHLLAEAHAQTNPIAINSNDNNKDKNITEYICVVD